MLKLILLIGFSSVFAMPSYASNKYDQFDDLWKKNVTSPSYERLFFDGHNVFLKGDEEEEKSQLDSLYQKNISKPHYKDQELLSIDHKGETITIVGKKKRKGRK